MTENYIDLESDEDSDYDEYEEFDYAQELIFDDQWEDTVAYQTFKQSLPQGWYILKITNFNAKKIQEIDEWLSSYCDNDYKRLGFSSGCGYTVGVGFESPIDATLFKLRW